MTDELRTGIDLLDRKLGGGLPPGCIVALSAEPASQSELVLYELAAARPTLYITTMRSASSVRETIERVAPPGAEVVVAGLDERTPLADALELVEALLARSNVVVDPVEVLEWQGPVPYWRFLNELRDRLAATDSVAVLHCLDGREASVLRDVTEYMVDVLFELSTEIDGSRIETHLSIPKFRGSHSPEDVFKLDMTDRIDVDTSRNIV